MAAGDKLDRAERLHRAGNYSESEALLHELLAERPDDPQLLLRIGTAQVMIDPARAAATLARAAALAPDDPALAFRAAHLLFHLGEHDDASRLVKAASRNARENFVLRWPLVHLAGRLAAMQGKRVLAERWLTAAFEEEPETSPHGRVLAEFLVEDGKREAALRVARKALRHRAQDEDLHALVRRLDSKG